ncbi:putative nucleic acid-binding protein, contains PIN domain [Geoglobus ahangari]|uniref:Ribonuclease VapC n=1 Tax=Geoglobus ahangari TaxID=113653 RepID=A0A0F7IFE8_9EURY|nr:type II toxin-antitoxin system VapC family toxin [Geoglobus ahangari]AKG91523.1 putative nucleic acid-binding protein, contains PIN domain [Geoglobus ahangari]
MILDTSALIRILRDRDFFEELSARISESIRITSITAYELQRGALYLMLKKGRDYEWNQIAALLSEIEILPFTQRDSEISARIWAKLRENGLEINDADIMISAIAIRENEKLLTLDRDFEIIGRFLELEVEILGG